MTTNKQKEQEEKKAYLERKKNLLEKEENNYQRVVFVRGTKGFYAVVGHSAVLLANKIAPELKIRVQIRRDGDYGVKSKEGMITLKNVGFYKEKFAQSGWLELEKEDESYIVFRMERAISEAEYELLKKSKELKRQKLENEILRSVPMPKLNTKLTEVLSVTYRFYRKHSDAISRQFVLDKLAEGVRYAYKIFMAICREEVPRAEGLKKIKAALASVQCDVMEVLALEIWTVEDCTTIGMKLVEAMLEIDREEKRV